MRRVHVIVAFLLALPLAGAAQELRLPNKPGSLKFAVIGDSGQPGPGQIGHRAADGRVALEVSLRVRADDR